MGVVFTVPLADARGSSEPGGRALARARLQPRLPSGTEVPRGLKSALPGALSRSRKERKDFLCNLRDLGERSALGRVLLGLEKRSDIPSGCGAGCYPARRLLIGANRRVFNPQVGNLPH